MDSASPDAAQRPTEPGVSPTESTGFAASRSARLPWTVAVLAVVVALVSVGALVVARPGESTDGQESGFASPEDAVDYFVGCVAEGDLAGAEEAFTVTSIVDGYSFQAHTERMRAVPPQTWLPVSSAGYRSVDENLRRGEIAGQLRAFVQGALAPERDFGMTLVLGEDLTAADLEAEFAPEDLGDLTVTRVDVMNPPGDPYSENLQASAEPYGAAEARDLAILYETADGPAVGGVTLLRYGDEWYIWGLWSTRVGTAPGELKPMSVEDYVADVAQALG